jgi:hypothetical protein
MPGPHSRRLTALLLPGAAALAACSLASSPQPPSPQASITTATSSTDGSGPMTVRISGPGKQPLPAPGALRPFAGTPAAARSLVAAFNGGFKLQDAHGGYYTEGRMVRPLIRGSASLVSYANGPATVGAWGSDVTMTPSVAAVRQNLFPLVVDAKPSARATTRTWRVWGDTCPCGAGQHGSEHQWRSGLGATADGGLAAPAISSPCPRPRLMPAAANPVPGPAG